MTNSLIGDIDILKRSVPTACVTCVWAGVDNAWEQEKLEARKMLENAAESHTSGARQGGYYNDIALVGRGRCATLALRAIGEIDKSLGTHRRA